MESANKNEELKKSTSKNEARNGVIADIEMSKEPKNDKTNIVGESSEIYLKEGVKIPEEKVTVPDKKCDKTDISNAKNIPDDRNLKDNVDEGSESFSEQVKIKRGKSRVKTNGECFISMEKSENSSDEDSNKRQKICGNQLGTELPECSASNSSSTFFHKLNSRVKKRYYRKENNRNDHEERSETPVQTLELAAEVIDAKSDSESDNDPLDFPHPGDQPELVTNKNDDGAEDEYNCGDNVQGADDSNEWTTVSEEEQDLAGPVLSKVKPKPKCLIVPELIDRQLGKNLHLPDRFYGSLQAVQRMELMHKLNEHQGCVNALSFNQKGNLLASASDDLIIKVWDWALGKRQSSFQPGHKSNIFQAKWLPLDSESIMVTSARDGQVRLLELSIGKSRKIAQHQGPVHKLAVHKETPHVILSCGEDGKIFSIDIRENKPKKILVVKEDSQEVQLYSVHLNPLNSNEFVIGGRTETVRVYDRRKLPTPLYKFCPSHLTENKCVHVTSVVYNYNGTEILASYNDEDIYLFDTANLHPSGDFAHRYQGHRNHATVKGVNFFGPRSEYVVSGSDCGNIFIWDKDTEAIIQWMSGDEEGVVNCLESHPYIPVLATSGLDYDVKIWIPSCEEIPSLEKLKDCVVSNMENRVLDIDDDADPFDGQMMWILLRRIRQSQRSRSFARARRMRASQRNYEDEDQNESTTEDDSSLNSESDNNDDRDVESFPCSPS